MPRLTPADKEVVRAMIDAQTTGFRDDYERMATIFNAVAARHGLKHAWRLEDIALWICEVRDQRER